MSMTVDELANVGLLDKQDVIRQVLNLPETREEFLKAFSIDVSGKIVPTNLNDGRSGIVTDSNLKQTSTVQAGLLALCLPISIMEIHVYQTVNGIREKKPDHPLQKILNKKPNSYTTRNAWNSALVYQLVFGGNHYAIPYGKGESLELEMIDVDRVVVKMGREEDGRPFLVYEVKDVDSDKQRVYQSNEIIHVKGFGEKSTAGDSLKERGGKDFLWEQALSTFGQSFFDNGAKPANAIKQDVSLSSMNIDLQRQVRDDFINHQGKNAGGTKVMPPGWELQNTAHSNEQNQYIESKTHAIQNAARILNTPLHKQKELSRGTYNNLAVVEQSFARDSLQPLTEGIEAEYGDKLFSTKEKADGYELMFDFKKLLKFDPVARSQYFNTAISAGWMTQNEVKIEEGQNPYNTVGDEPMVNGGMKFIKDLGKEKE